jgi:exonuclease SbcC
MIKRIVLENYLSHARTVIEPAAGLTVLLGPNNCGKSAVVSALQTLARNASGEYMIRHGQKQARVTVETSDGHELVWRRKGSTVSYVLDGREVHRLHGGVPDDLHQMLKLPTVQSPGEAEDFEIHFAEQKSPVFLLGESGSRAAMFFSASSDAGRLLGIQDRHREKVREQKSRRKSLVCEIEQIDVELSTLGAIDEIEPLLAQAESAGEEIARRDAACARLKDLIAGIEQCSLRARQCARRASAIKPLAPPPVQHDLKPLMQMIASMEQAAHRRRQAHALGRAVAPLPDPPALADPGPLERQIGTIRAASRRLVCAAARCRALSGLPDPPAQSDPTALARLILEMESCQKKAASCRREVADVDARIAHVAGQITTWARNHPNCPICGSTISGEALLQGAHEHG